MESEDKKVVAATEPGVWIRVRVSETLHRRLKADAAIEGKNLDAKVVEVLADKYTPVNQKQVA